MTDQLGRAGDQDRRLLDHALDRTARRGVERSPRKGPFAFIRAARRRGQGRPSKHYVQLVRKLVKDRHHVRVLIGEVEREQLAKEDLDHLLRGEAGGTQR